MWHNIRVEITGSSQGLFHGEDPTGKPGLVPCIKFAFAAKKKNDAGRKDGLHSSATASLNKPVKLLLPWGPSSPQLWSAYWSNEALSAVKITAALAAGHAGEGQIFQKVTLSNATIVGIEQLLETPRDHKDDVTRIPNGAAIYGSLHVRMRYEQIEVEHPLSQTQAQHGAAMPRVPSLGGALGALRK